MREKIKILEKAWQVSNPEIASFDDEQRVVYAIKSGEAKRQYRGDYDYYTDLHSIRVKEYDIIEYKGQQIKRFQLTEIVRKEKRMKNLANIPEDELFYVQDGRGYIGNSISWWGLNSCGYTTDITKAQKYTKAEIIARFSAGRETDVIWVASNVDKNVSTHVDSQRIDRDYSYN